MSLGACRSCAAPRPRAARPGRAGAPRGRTAGPEDITSAEATAAAEKDPKVVKEQDEHPDLIPSPTFKHERWEVGWFEDDHEYALVMVDPKTGEVTESWTGYQVAWEMARGYSGEFAHSLNSPFIWIPLCLFFLIGLFDWRRLRRIANLDLLVLLGFGVSHFFFNQGEHRGLGPARLSGARLPAGELPLDRVPRAGARGCGRSGRRSGCWSRRSS